MKSKKPLTPDAARVRAEELCVRAEHSAGEIREKLLKWGIMPYDADKIISGLIRDRYIDDLRFARAYSRDKLEYSHWGKRKIALSLYQKKVERDIINEALDEIDGDKYIEALRNVIASKKRTLAEPDTYEGRTKLFRFAVSRGFEPSLIASILSGRSV